MESLEQKIDTLFIFEEHFEKKCNFLCASRKDCQSTNTDLMVIAAIDRFLKGCNGFRVLIKALNSQCAAIIARSLLDTLARFCGLKSYPEPQEYAKCFLSSSGKLSKLNINGKKLYDKELIDLLSIDYPNIPRFYEEFCKYAHLSEVHLKACSRMVKKDQSMEFTVIFSEKDWFLEPKSYILLVDCVLMLGEIFLKEIEAYFINNTDNIQ